MRLMFAGTVGIAIATARRQEGWKQVSNNSFTDADGVEVKIVSAHNPNGFYGVKPDIMYEGPECRLLQGVDWCSVRMRISEMQAIDSVKIIQIR